jgi:hypothetical protein
MGRRSPDVGVEPDPAVSPRPAARRAAPGIGLLFLALDLDDISRVMIVVREPAKLMILRPRAL